MSYVDGYVLPVPKKKIAAYRKMASVAGKVWREHGALEYKECVGDDLRITGMPPFGRKVMKDPRITASMTKDMPFDHKRMAYGGFKILVEA